MEFTVYLHSFCPMSGSISLVCFGVIYFVFLSPFGGAKRLVFTRFPSHPLRRRGEGLFVCSFWLVRFAVHPLKRWVLPSHPLRRELSQWESRGEFFLFYFWLVRFLFGQFKRLVFVWLVRFAVNQFKRLALCSCRTGTPFLCGQKWGKEPLKGRTPFRGFLPLRIPTIPDLRATALKKPLGVGACFMSVVIRKWLALPSHPLRLKSFFFLQVLLSLSLRER